jgi:hypothetical protein
LPSSTWGLVSSASRVTRRWSWLRPRRFWRPSAFSPKEGKASLWSLVDLIPGSKHFKFLWQSTKLLHSGWTIHVNK